MGYQTYFSGQFLLDRPLTPEHKKILDDFNTERHDPGTVPEFKGPYSYYCQWRPNADGTAIEWDEGEKFYDYVEWMRCLCDKFLTPWGYMVAGIVQWDGEESGDMGQIIIASPNIVTTRTAVITFQ